jgi:hypothetical protein
MTYLDPIFSQGLFGKANFAVCNQWSDAARFSKASADAVSWAQTQAQKPLSMARALCQVTAATVIPGTSNRWNYTISLWVPPSPSGASGLTPPTDAWFSVTNCKNIREDYNTSTLADGMDLTSPAASIGPVGSRWSSSTSSWVTTELLAHVDVSIFVDRSGAAYYYFDRPNPIRCTT